MRTWLEVRNFASQKFRLSREPEKMTSATSALPFPKSVPKVDNKCNRWIYYSLCAIKPGP